METVSANKFRDQLKQYVDQTAANHEPLHVTRRRGGDFVVMSLEDYNAEQETMAILRDDSLMTQIRRSLQTMRGRTGRVVDSDEL